MMTKIVIIGATGSVGRVARQLFLEKTNDELTLFSRRTERLKPVDSTREIAVSGDVMNASGLDKVISGQDVVFASLTGNLGKMAKAIVESMKRVGVNRLIFITSMGIYNEIPALPAIFAPIRYCRRTGMRRMSLRFPGWIIQSSVRAGSTAATIPIMKSL